MKKFKNDQPSHSRLVKCRVCKLELKWKNYGDHLLVVHPGENSKNLSTLTDQSISSFFSSKGDSSRKRQRDSDVFDVHNSTDEEAPSETHSGVENDEIPMPAHVEDDVSQRVEGRAHVEVFRKSKIW